MILWELPEYEEKKGSPARRESVEFSLLPALRQGKESVMDENKETLLGDAETGAEGSQGKTFTQEDVNRIVQERLAKERSKGNSSNEELDKRAAELDQRERRLSAVEELRKNGLPDYLADVLNIGTEEELKNSIAIITKMKGEIAAATTQDPVVIGTGNPIGTVRKGGGDADFRAAFGLVGK